MKKPSQQARRRAVVELRKILHRHRGQGEARLRVLATIAAEGISRQLGSAMRRELQPDAVALAKTRKCFRHMAKASELGKTKD